jgi:hypothetical protein
MFRWQDCLTGNDLQIIVEKTSQKGNLSNKKSPYRLLMEHRLSSGCSECFLPTTATHGTSWDDFQDVEPHSF